MAVRRLPVRPDLEQFIVRPRNSSAPFMPAMRMRSPSSRAPFRIDRPVRREVGGRAARTDLPRFELDEARPRGAARRSDLAR